MERKEAIEVIKKNWPDSSFTMLREALETIIPELKESEDEKIRKALIDLFSSSAKKDWRDIPTEKILAWLEKRSEPTDINPSEFDLRLNKLLKQFETLPKEELASCLSFYLNVVQNDGTYKDEEEQGEQNPTDKLEDEEYNGEDYGIDSLFHAQRILEKTLGKVNGYQTDDGILSHECAITAVKKLYEQKLAEWSEEDMSKVQRICKYLNEAKKYYADITEVRECINWLKSLKDRVQPKQEWSEEDIRNIENIDSILFYDKDLPEDTCVRLRNWLKSLRPQSQWKPSDEQIEGIRLARSFVVDDFGEHPTLTEILIELEEQLQKIKENKL